MKLLAIAKNAYRQSVRQPIFYILLVTSLALILGSPYTTFFAFGEEIKMIKDMGFATITICCLLIAILSASNVIAEEMDKKTIMTILSKPVARGQFILGKFLGIIYSALLATIVLTLIFLLTLWQVEKRLDLVILPTVFLIYIQVIILTAISVGVSTRAGLVLNIVLCSFIFVLGRLSNYLIKFFQDKDLLTESVGKVLYTVIPNLENFNVSGAAVLGTPIPGDYLLRSLLYGIIYTTIALAGAVLLFQRREIR